MSETYYHWRPALSEPVRFFARAAADIRHAGPVAWQLFLSSVRARRQRAGLGYLWLVIPSLATTGVAALLQSRGILTAGSGGLPYPAYALVGIVLWQVFTEAMASPLQQFSAGRQLLTRSRVPQEALILAGLYEVGLNCAIRTLVLAGALIWLGVSPGPFVWLVPAGMAALALLGVTIGLVLAPLGLLFDDVGRGLPLGTTLWFFLTPVVYAAPSTAALGFNPVTPLLESTRAWLTGGSASRGFVTVTACAAIGFALAWLFQRVARPHVIARLG